MTEREYRLILSFAEGVGPVTYRDIIQYLEQESLSAENLFQEDHSLLDGLEIKEKTKLSIQKLTEYLPRLSETFDMMADRDVTIVMYDEEIYPRRLSEALGKAAPVALYCFGNLELFVQDSIAVVGARKADEDALSWARRAGREAVDRGKVVVSGCARGIDSAAQFEALDAGGNTIGVLGHGIMSGRLENLLPVGLEQSSCLLVSQFGPMKRWSSASASIRNRTIAALSDAVVVIQAAGRGGSLNCGRGAQKIEKPVYTIEPLEPDLPSWEGNSKLLKEGATALKVNEQSGEIDFSPVFEKPEPIPKQQNLW